MRSASLCVSMSARTAMGAVVGLGGDAVAVAGVGVNVDAHVGCGRCFKCR